LIPYIPIDNRVFSLPLLNFDIGDYTGIVALAATAITFALTYRHGTQSEQTRIARETWEKISERNNEFNEMVEKYKEQYMRR
jgi:hypothetical protein